MDVITELTEVLKARQGADPDDSYVASLYARGLNKILEKVGEEATEFILAAKDHTPGDEALVKEAADLWFHSMIALVDQGVPPQAVLDELASRFGVSGHTEKASRG